MGMKYAACEDLVPSLTTGFFFFSRFSTEFPRSGPALTLREARPRAVMFFTVQERSVTVCHSAGSVKDCPAVRGDRAAGGKGFPGLNCARVCVYRCTFRRRRDFQGNRRFSKDSVMQKYTASFLGRDCPAWSPR